MGRHRLRIAVLLSVLTVSPAMGAGFAKIGTFGFSYDGIFTGTRLTSLGQADMAGASGPGATQINTAPLTLGNGIEGEYGRSDFLADTQFEVWGGAAEIKRWRLGFARTRFFMDPQLVRTAYNPEGTGETFEAGDDINIISLGYDLGGLIDRTGRWSWTLGAAYRGYHSFFAESEINETTWDLGTGVAWKTPHPDGWARLSWAVSWQNVFSEGFVFDEREASLPRSVRAGVTLESTFGSSNWGSEAFKVLMAFSHRFVPDSWLGRDTDHFGLEVIGAGILAVRMGHNSRMPGQINTWGAGLVLDQDFMGRFTLAADYGRYDTLIEEVDMWSVRARYAF